MGKTPHAALRTARFTDEVIAAAAGCIGKRCIDDLDKGLRHVGSMDFALCAMTRDVWLDSFALESRLLRAGEGIFRLDRG
jgi:hypothetical protein